MTISILSRRRPLVLGIVVALAITASALVTMRSSRNEARAGCPAGYTSYAEMEQREGHVGSAAAHEGEEGAADLEGLCISNKHPESLAELSIMRSQRASIYNAPSGRVLANARALSLAQRDALAAKPRTDELSHP